VEKAALRDGETTAIKMEEMDPTCLRVTENILWPLQVNQSNLTINQWF
jgi:hypothetical protein